MAMAKIDINVNQRSPRGATAKAAPAKGLKKISTPTNGTARKSTVRKTVARKTARGKPSPRKARGISGLDAADLLNGLHMGALVLDGIRCVLAINGNLLRQTGLPDDFARVGEAFAEFAQRATLLGESAFIALGDVLARGDGPEAVGPALADCRIVTAHGALLLAQTSMLPNGALLVTLSDGPAAEETDHRQISDLLASMVENIPFLVSVRETTAMTYVMVNRAFEEMFEIRREDVLGKSITDLFSSDDTKRRCDHNQEVIKSGIPMEFPKIIVDITDREPRRFKTQKFPLSDAAGKVTHILTITEDITERQESLEALEESEQRLRDIAESAIDWFWEMGADMRFSQVLRGPSDANALDASATIGKFREDIALPENWREDPEKWARYDDDRNNHRPFRDFVFRAPMANGGTGHVKVNGKPIFDRNGAFNGYRGTATDITAQVEAEARAERARTQTMEAIESVTDGFALYDSDDRLVICNRQYRDMWPGIEDVAVPGATYEDMVRAAVKSGELAFSYPEEELYVAEWLTAHRKPPSSREQQFRDGRWLQVTHRATSDGGIVITCTDITDMKEREEGLRKSGYDAVRAKESGEVANRSKSEFLANMSHELRTPLNAVIGFSEIINDAMLGDAPNDTHRTHARDIHSSVKHLLELINYILDMSKIEAGKLELLDEEIDLRRMVDSSIILVRERAQQSHITLDVVIPDDLPRLRADLRKVKQILINLLSNAVKFTRPDGRVTVESFVTPEQVLILQVVDTGIGMNPEEIEKALEPFGQIDSGLNRAYEGTGLGLTNALVEEHDGVLEITSRYGDGPTGTTVSVCFPPDRVIER